MPNLLTNGDFRTGAVDVKVGVGSGTVTTSTAALGAWALNVDEHDATTNKYVRIRNMVVAAAVAAGKVTEPPATVIGDNLLLFDRETSSLGSTRVGFAKVAQVITASPRALSNQNIEVNLFIYSAVDGLVGLSLSMANVYAGGALTSNIINENVQVVAGWNRVRRFVFHPNVLDTDPAKGAYVSGSHTLTITVDDASNKVPNINQNVTVAITGAYVGLATAEFDRIEEIARANQSSATAATLPNGIPRGGSALQVLQKNSNTDYDVSFNNLLSVAGSGTVSGAQALSFATPQLQTSVLSGDASYTTSNRFSGGFLSMKIDAGGSSRALTFSASWKWLGTDYSAGVTLASGKIAVLSLTCYGNAETDIVAVYVAQP